MASINGPGLCFNEICEYLHRNGKYQELSDLISNLLRLYDKYVGRIGVEIGEVHVLLGEMYERTKRSGEARGQWEKAIRIFKEIGDQGWLAVALTGLGENQLDRGEWLDAEQNFHNVLEILRENYPKCELDLANAKRSLGNALWELGKGKEAVDIYEEALRVYAKLGKSKEQRIVEEKLGLMKTGRRSAPVMRISRYRSRNQTAILTT